MDLYTWYLFLESERRDYLTIAFCSYDEEVAIKVRGEDKGKIVLINRDLEGDPAEFETVDISNSFSEFLEILY